MQHRLLNRGSTQMVLALAPAGILSGIDVQQGMACNGPRRVAGPGDLKQRKLYIFYKIS